MASIDYVVLRRPRLRGGIGGNTAVLLWSITGIVVLVIGLPFGLIATIPALLVQLSDTRKSKKLLIQRNRDRLTEMPFPLRDR